MRITGIELLEVRLPLREPFVSSAASRSDRRLLLVRAEGADGGEGWSECVAGEDPSYSPETTETAWHVLTEFVLPSLAGAEFLGPEEIAASLAWIRGHPMARAAGEMVAWDLQARELGAPLWELVGGSGRPVPVGVSLGMHADTEALLDRIAAYLERGYVRVKLKIAPGRDIEVIEAVRGRFPKLPLMVDANSAYSESDAASLLELDALDLLLIEQPLRPEDLLGHARLQESLATPICLDESIASLEDAEVALEVGACRVINIKPGRVGGLGQARAIHDLCLERGVDAWCGGMLESGIGRAHNLALATLPGFTLAGDLSESRRYWERDLVDPEFVMSPEGMAPSFGAGIGVEPDRDRIREIAVRGASFGSLVRPVGVRVRPAT